MSLIAQGFRLMVNPEPFEVKWIHPAEVSQMIAAGWKDATDMDDDEYDDFIDSIPSSNATTASAERG